MAWREVNAGAGGWEWEDESKRAKGRSERGLVLGRKTGTPV
jgi:hypothetical protein